MSDRIYDDRKQLGPDHPAFKKVDHLTYLKKEPSLFPTEEDERLEQLHLVCAHCGHLATKVAEKIEIFGAHLHAFTNLGYLVEVGCFRNAPGCTGVNRISTGYSWFRGYNWQIVLCKNCYNQLGWEYISPTDSFYGLMLKMLREEEPGIGE